MEVVTWRVAAWSEPPGFEAPSVAEATGPALPYGSRAARFVRDADAVAVPVYRRADLRAGHTFAGPALVEERETTSVILGGWSCAVATDGSIIATREVQ